MSAATSTSSSASSSMSRSGVTISSSVDNKENKYDNDILQVLDDLEFKGFDPKAFRDSLKGKADATMVAKCLSGYVQIGNNPNNADSKRRKKPIRDFGKGFLSKEITLARLAIAFMPMLLVIRLIAKTNNKLRNQFPASKVDPLFQDVAFSGWKGQDILSFLIMFDDALSRTGGKNKQHGEAEVLRWMNVAQSGFDSDLEVKNLLMSQFNKETIIKWFEGCF